jgi:hypothetical protein
MDYIRPTPEEAEPISPFLEDFSQSFRDEETLRAALIAWLQGKRAEVEELFPDALSEVIEKKHSNGRSFIGWPFIRA